MKYWSNFTLKDARIHNVSRLQEYKVAFRARKVWNIRGTILLTAESCHRQLKKAEILVGTEKAVVFIL